TGATAASTPRPNASTAAAAAERVVAAARNAPGSNSTTGSRPTTAGVPRTAIAAVSRSAKCSRTSTSCVPSAKRRGSQLGTARPVQPVEHLLRVAVRPHALEDLRNDTILVDDERRALDA